MSISVGSSRRRTTAHRAHLAPLAAVLLLADFVAAADKLVWRLDEDHRYVWLREGQKVGESVFRVERLPDGEGDHVYVVTSRRSYDYEDVSQRAESSTVLSEKLAPIRFEEKLVISALGGAGSRQDVRLEVKEGVANVSWVHNGNSAKPTRDRVDLPEGCFLHASQAVDHWALFMTTVPAGAQKHLLRLYYPDFGRILEVTFTVRGEDVLRIGEKDIAATRYEFQADILAGLAWRDADGRLVQVEFPESGLRVVLSPSRAAKSERLGESAPREADKEATPPGNEKNGRKSSG